MTMTALALTHARFRILETIRIPIAVVGGAFFPAASMLFFVVPFAGDDRVGATYATASMVMFAVMTSSLFTYGVGVSEDRAQPWDPYMRTLPVGPAAAFAGRILSGLTFMALSLLPVVIIGWLFTAATASAGQLLLALAAVVLGALPFTFMGLAIGYSLPTKAALAVAQIIFFPLAFGGGLLSAPDDAPKFVETIAPYLPTRGAVELVWATVGDFQVSTTSMVALAAWTLAVAGLAAWAYRRDEGTRFS
jgi:ABC-2 type transport system permease protein